MEGLQAQASHLKESIRKLRSIGDKLRNQSKDAVDMESIRIEGFVLFLEIQALHTNLQQMFKRLQDNVETQKTAVDKRNLVLQSLKYEEAHFIKEINACRDIGSEIHTLAMLSEQEFLASKPSMASLDKHELTLERLKDELEERKRLVAKVEELQACKAELVAGREQNQKTLGGLDAKIQYLFKKAWPVQEMVLSTSKDLPASLLPDGPNELELARALPTPLYLLYSTLRFYRSSLALDCKVTIVPQAESVEV
eukprot:g55161.t1